jgi:hypothetical protein
VIGDWWLVVEFQLLCDLLLGNDELSWFEFRVRKIVGVELFNGLTGIVRNTFIFGNICTSRVFVFGYSIGPNPTMKFLAFLIAFAPLTAAFAPRSMQRVTLTRVHLIGEPQH